MSARLQGVGPPVDERLVEVPGGRLRLLANGPARVAASGDVPRGQVVIVPGMGALGYLLPLLRELGRREVAAVVLDLPGFGSRRPLRCPPTLPAIAAVTAGYVRGCGAAQGPVTLLGHSSGAPAVVRAALELQDDRPVAAVVLAGPVPAPTQRSMLGLLSRAPRAFRHDSPRELVVLPDYARGGLDSVRLLRSAVADRPERYLPRLRAPLTVTAGTADAFAPGWWLELLAGCAVQSAWRQVAVLPGSHNNPFTHPSEVADVVHAATPH